MYSTYMDGGPKKPEAVYVRPPPRGSTVVSTKYEEKTIFFGYFLNLD